MNCTNSYVNREKDREKTDELRLRRFVKNCEHPRPYSYVYLYVYCTYL